MRFWILGKINLKGFEILKLFYYEKVEDIWLTIVRVLGLIEYHHELWIQQTRWSYCGGMVIDFPIVDSKRQREWHHKLFSISTQSFIISTKSCLHSFTWPIECDDEIRPTLDFLFLLNVLRQQNPLSHRLVVHFNNETQLTSNKTVTISSLCNIAVDHKYFICIFTHARASLQSTRGWWWRVW